MQTHLSCNEKNIDCLYLGTSGSLQLWREIFGYKQKRYVLFIGKVLKTPNTFWTTVLLLHWKFEEKLHSVETYSECDAVW